MNPSQEQINSAWRTLITAAGSSLATWAVAKGWISQAQVTAILSNEQFISTATTLVLMAVGSLGVAASGTWGVITHKQANLVATVAKMPEVAKVETMPTAEGVALADAATAAAPMPGALVTVARR
ncbi:MAG TPA: hypothetical protein VN663_22990 [Ramlibacter sp.]|nr:hypothetical protein [Ramlibacter sp.]